MTGILRMARKLEKFFGLACIRLSPLIRPGMATKSSIYFYGRWGMKFVGRPNYLSARINFDGTNYELIEIHKGVTISSFVRVLTHDWSLHTVSKAMGYIADKPLGKIKGIRIGEYSFIGTGSVIMPGADIGRGCLIGAGTVVRGVVPDFSIVVGSPGMIIGDSRSKVAAQLRQIGIDPKVISTIESCQ